MKGPDQQFIPVTVVRGHMETLELSWSDLRLGSEGRSDERSTEMKMG